MSAVYYQIAIPCPLPKTFDYLPPQDEAKPIQPGMRVSVPFGRRQVVGFCLKRISQTDVPPDKLKRISEVLDIEPLFPENALNFLKKISQYYHHAIGEVFVTGLPVSLKKGKPTNVAPPPKTLPPLVCPFVPEFELTTPQQTAISAVEQSFEGSHTFLLKGVTGSGKTEVYLQIIAKMLEKGYQALVLVPEIALTPQTVDRFQSRFGDWVQPYHSQLTPKTRQKTWEAAHQGDARIVIGTRSALFLPFCRLGIIIVDEEHDPSFKQQEGFRYFARDMAVLKGHLEKFPVLLGSATPALESIHNVTKEKYTLLELPQRANIKATLPTVTCLDVRHKKLNSGLSAQLTHEIKNTLQKGEQALLFLNRRGYAPALMCFACGWLAECQRCETRLTYHQNKNQLICHHCESSHAFFSQCPSCGGDKLSPLGSGTERIEEAIQETFPETPILRIDSDTTRKKGSLQACLDKIHTNAPMILIGTQMLAKGHHFPNVTLVAIIDADGGLFSTDFRAIERMGQQIVQVAGRAGRDTKKGQVLIQTFHPEHPLIQTLLQEGYWPFAEKLLTERQESNLPPFSALALFRAQSKQSQYAQSFLQNLAQIIRAKMSSQNIVALGPIPAPLARKNDQYRFQLLINAVKRGELQSLLKEVLTILSNMPKNHRVRWSLDVDPIDLV